MASVHGAGGTMQAAVGEKLSMALLGPGRPCYSDSLPGITCNWYSNGMIVTEVPTCFVIGFEATFTGGIHV